jgi:PAS domain S-box-containing protein
MLHHMEGIVYFVQKRNTYAMSHTKQFLTTLCNALPEGVFAVDADKRIVFFNRSAERITGIGARDALGRYCWEVLRAECCTTNCPLMRTLETGESFFEHMVTMIAADGTRVPISIATSVFHDSTTDTTYAIESFRDQSNEYSPGAQYVYKHTSNNIVSISPAMQKIFDKLPMIAQSNSTVLIQGETGTGKELFARAIHDLSQRHRASFVAINCGALPDTLLESELFGYKAGAFTDAKKDKPGRLAAASKGTLFLDEVGEMSSPMQVKLLRVLQEHTYEPLGAVESCRSDARVIAATNKDLTEEVAGERFRSDLFYRLDVIHIEVPPLRERPEDIPVLADYFLSRIRHQQHKKVKNISPAAMEVLRAYAYPGNVRELENIMEHAVVMCTSDHIEPAHLPARIREGTGEQHSHPSPPRTSQDFSRMEADFIRQVLERFHWNRSKAARHLGMHRTSLYRKMRALGIGK